jgi:transposase
LTTKIHTLADAQGRPLRFILSAGQDHDSTTAADLLADRTTTGVIADKAYDTDALRKLIGNAQAEAVIPSKSNRKVQIPHDAVAYKLRNRIERFFNKLKHLRHIATELSPNFGDGLRVQAAAVWDCEDAGLVATSIPSVNLTP